MDDHSAGQRSALALADGIARAGLGLTRTVGAGVGPDEATRILRAWLTQLELEFGADGLLAPTHHHPTRRPESAGRPARTASAPQGGRPRRVALVADDLTSGHGLANILANLCAHGVPDHVIEILGADVAPISGRHFDLVHACTPGPAGMAALLHARAAGIPVIGMYHIHVHALDASPQQMLGSFYGQCALVLSPSRFADRALRALGVPEPRIARWQPGVERSRFHPACYDSDSLPDAFNVLYAGRLGADKGLDLLADAFQIARDRDPRLHLVLAGTGPYEPRLRSRLSAATATFLARLDTERLTRVYATADLLVFPSETDTFGQVVLEAQASGLPVLAVDAGGAPELIQNGRSGCLVPPEPAALAGAMRGLARRATLQDRLATGGLMAVRDRTWERSLGQLASAYARAVGEEEAGGTHEVARAA